MKRYTARKHPLFGLEGKWSVYDRVYDRYLRDGQGGISIYNTQYAAIRQCAMMNDPYDPELRKLLPEPRRSRR